jgi:hypothetical protein
MELAIHLEAWLFKVHFSPGFYGLKHKMRNNNNNNNNNNYYKLRYNLTVNPLHLPYKEQLLNASGIECEICAPLGYYAASSGNPLPTFRDHVSFPS